MKPHCYGEMNWILKYDKENIPERSICDCCYKKSCLEKTLKNKENTKERKWVAEISNSDIWRGDKLDTKEQAIAEGRKLAIEKGLNKFRIGETEPAFNFGIDVDSVIERISETMYEDIGEVAEDYLDDVKSEHLLELEEKLNEVFFKWQKEHGYEPTFYKIINIEEINV